MGLSESLAAELLHEARATRRMLERVPEDRLAWRPHEKSRTLGETAAHIAHLPGLFIATVGREGFDRFEYEVPAATVAGIAATFDRNVAAGVEALKAQTDESLAGAWRYTYGERVLFELPRAAVVRALGLNHLIHHRGQLSVYLRLLDVPLPSVYGPTADEA
jgi:uncharacterized damage-inducible protein DinB